VVPWSRKSKLLSGGVKIPIANFGPVSGSPEKTRVVLYFEREWKHVEMKNNIIENQESTGSKTRRNPMRNHFLRIHLVLFFLLLAQSIFSSPPPPGWVPEFKCEGAPLKINWEAGMKPIFISWFQPPAIIEPATIAPDSAELIYPRKGVKELPDQIIIVPEDPRLAPELIPIATEAVSLHFITAEIPPDEVWFWGVTPNDPYYPPPDCLPRCHDVQIRQLNDISHNAQLRGSFLWRMKAPSGPEKRIPFYFSDGPNVVEAVQSEGFQEARMPVQAMADAHVGGKCRFVFETVEDGLGKSYQIRFTLKKGIDPAAGPLY